MSDPFETLGVPPRFGLDSKLLEQRHRDLSRALHPDRYVQASPAERRLALERASAVNDAFRILRDPRARAAALLARMGRTVEEHTRADPALLIEIMELREQLDALREAHDRAPAVAALRAQVERHVADEERAIAEAFDAPEGSLGPQSPAVERAYQALVKLRYLARFLEEADSIEENA